MRKKTVFITGGATGIGKMTAIHFAENGCDLVINYRSSKEAAESLADKLIESYEINCLLVQGDICKKEDCEKIASLAVQRFPSIDILIHNAGPYIHERKRMTDYTYEEWNDIFSGNLTSVFYLSKLLLPGMRKNGWGRIITIGYDRAETAPGWIYRSAFAAAKTGLVSLTRTIAMEEAENGITANMVAPGDIVPEWKEKEIADAILIEDGNAPVGRHGTGEDIARVIGFLAEEQSGFITGSVIPVTGGLDVLGKFHRL
ncbi:SDR family oxidoreductase [Neobacillus notoginsengisoli]|uniref:SDR family oxidoreductase n=1 Tax=Neobacillus notoginsengisoli TaxID=1578198 RepID=A0A417YXJ7_9BACI|nr:SDR family oxidoreductase [Neobacillus notoginsengisoli]RHW42337.1 SDR family oxidoreductase [Neobacillus notoginsengisoli]